MFKLALRQFRTEKPGFIGTFLTLLTIAFIAGINIVAQSILNSITTSTGSEMLLNAAKQSFTMILTFFIQLMFITVMISVNYSIKRRWHQFVSLRMQGASSWQLRRIIIFETMILTAVAFIVASPLIILLGKPYYDWFSSSGFLPSSAFSSGDQTLISMLITFLVLVAVSALIAFFASMKLKKITMTEINDKNSLGTGKITALRLAFGIPLTLLPIFVFFILPMFGMVSMEGMFGQGLMALALFNTIIGLALLSKYILAFFFNTFKGMSRGTNKFFFSSLRGSINKVGGATIGIATILTFQMVISSSFTIAAEAVSKANAIYYENLNVYSANDAQAAAQAGKDGVTITEDGNVQLGYLTGQPGSEISSFLVTTAQVVDGKFPFNIKDGTDGPTFGGELKGKTITPGKVWVTRNLDMFLTHGQEVGINNILQVGSKVKLYNTKFPKPNHVREFEIEKFVYNLSSAAGFPEFYFSSEADANGNTARDFLAMKPNSKAVISENEITELADRKVDFNEVYKQSEAKSKNTIFIVTAVVISLSGIGILNAFFLYIFDRKKEYELQLVIGRTTKELTRETILEALMMVLFGTLFAMFATFTFTIPFSQTNVQRTILFTNVDIILLTYLALIMIVVVFVYVITKLLVINKIKTANITS